MAEVTEISGTNGITTPIPPIPEKRKPGRPRKTPAPPPDLDDDDHEDEELAALADESEDWELHCQNLTQDEWSQRLAYLTRLAPTTEKRSAGRKINTATYARSFTLEDIKKEHGSGVYRIRFLVLTQPSGRYRKYREDFIDIVDPKYPPNLPYGEWIDRPENEAWKWAGPALLMKQQEEAAKAGAPMPVINGAGGAYPPGLNFNELLLRVTEANDPKKLVEFFKTMTPPPDTTTAVILGKLLDASLAKTADAPKPDTTYMDRMFKMQDEMLKDMREELRSMRDKTMNAPPAKSIIEQFVELRPQIKELVDAFAMKAGKTDVWAELAKEGIGQLPDVISLIRDVAVKKNEAQQPNGRQPAAIATAATTSTEVLSTKPIEQMTDDEKRKYIDELWKKWGNQLLKISTHLVEEFTIQDQGYSFRDWYVEMYGKLNWADLKRDLPPELITNMYLAHEPLRKVLSPPEKLTRFLIQFQTPFGEETDVTVEDESGHVDTTAAGSAPDRGEAK